MEERLQKILSAAGACSRRAAEGYIRAGRVAVNGETAHLGQKADPERDRITLDGAPVGAAPEQFLYLMLHKPRGYVTTVSDEQGRKTVMDLLTGIQTRVYPVGRLDRDSEGLLLLTNDGALTQRLLHLTKLPRPDDAADALAIALCHSRTATSLIDTDRVFDAKKYDTR